MKYIQEILIKIRKLSDHESLIPYVRVTTMKNSYEILILRFIDGYLLFHNVFWTRLENSYRTMNSNTFEKEVKN